MESVFVSQPCLQFPPSQFQTLALARLPDTLNIRRRSTGEAIFRSSRFFPIRAAISRKTKEETVRKIKDQLENCCLFSCFHYRGLTVKQFQRLRSKLPETSKLIVAKNTLVRIAVAGTPWEAMEPCLKYMNAWLFVHSEEIHAAIKPFRDFQEEYDLQDNDFTGAVFEGKFYGSEEFKELETMPSRADIYAKLLGSLKGPASALIGTIQSPAMDLMIILNARVKKLQATSDSRAN